jgi:hypothetical protein
MFGGVEWLHREHRLVVLLNVLGTVLNGVGIVDFKVLETSILGKAA